MLKIDAKPLSDVYKSSRSCGVRDARCSRLLRAYDQRPAGQETNRKKEEEDRKRGAPYVG
jgi:hypothetical protein